MTYGPLEVGHRAIPVLMFLVMNLMVRTYSSTAGLRPSDRQREMLTGPKPATRYLSGARTLRILAK